jgi:mono/diheme cytochrome c family protein
VWVPEKQMGKPVNAPVVRLIAGMICAIAGNAQAQQLGNPQRGFRFAQDACSECHFVDKTSGLSPVSAAPTFATIAKTAGLTSAALIVMLQNSHQTMPHIVIKGQDMSDLVAYILSLKEGD